MGGVACENGLTGHCAKYVAKDWDTLWHVREGKGLSAQKLNQMESTLGRESGRLKVVADAGR